MAQKTITTSPNIAVLESKIVTDLCIGKFFIDLSPTLFLGAGATNVLGAKIKILDQFDTPIKPYSVSYDILPPMTGIYQFLIPKSNGVYQYSTFNISIEITDANGTKYEITQAVKVCQPDIKNRKKNYGQINAKILGNCKQGIVNVLLNEPPVYNGFLSESRTQTYTLYYPTGTIAIPEVTTQSNFQVALFEGDYLVKGDVCVTYNFGENNYAKVPYKVECEKKIKCLVDFCIVFGRMQEIGNQIRKDDCVNKEDLSNILLTAVSLLETIRLGNDCGEDIGNEITELEQLLGVECSCSIDGTPISPIVPASSIVINGCNVTSVPGANTTTYTINNYEFVVTVNPANNSFLVIAPPSLNSCTKTQELTFSVSALYTEIKGFATNDEVYWINLWKKGAGLSAANIACLGLTTSQYNALTGTQLINNIVAKMCGCCGSSNCNVDISVLSQTISGQNTVINWTNDLQKPPYGVVIYVDGILIDTIVFPTNPYPVMYGYLLTGYNDGVQHQVKIRPTCSNGLVDTVHGQEIFINNAGCPTILPPSLNASTVNAAVCPFNLSTLIAGGTPVGLTIEWHTANNMNADTKVPNPQSVGNGTFYAFYSNVNKCNSPASQVTINCAVAGNATAPLNLLVVEGAGTTNLVTFNSASTPPPSYLVKRKLASAPDVNGSYSSLGAPTFNAGSNKWELTDTGAVINTLYTYKAESQATDGSRPYTLYEFARITCPTVSLTSTNNQISYSFVNVGGEVNKYVVELFDNVDLVVASQQVIIPAFTNPIIGAFASLLTNRSYSVKVTPFINTVNGTCTPQMINTLANNIIVDIPAKLTAPATTYNIKVNGATVYTGSTLVTGQFQGFFAGLNINNATVLLTLTSTDNIGINSLVTGTGTRPADVLTATTAQWNNVTWPKVQINFSV